MRGKFIQIIFQVTWFLPEKMHANSKNSVQFIFQKLVNMYKYNTKSWWEGGVIQDIYAHTRHIYAAPRFVIYNTEKKIKYKVLDQLAPLKLIYPPPHPPPLLFLPTKNIDTFVYKNKIICSQCTHLQYW